MPPTLQRYTNNSNYACFSYKSHLLSFQLNDVTAPSEVITSPPSVSQGDFGDDETVSKFVQRQVLRAYIQDCWHEHLTRSVPRSV